jgi:hypothetical protein
MRVEGLTGSVPSGPGRAGLWLTAWKSSFVQVEYYRRVSLLDAVVTQDA